MTHETCAYCEHFAESAEPEERFGYCSHPKSGEPTTVEGGDEAYRDNIGSLRVLSVHRCKRFECIKPRAKRNGSD